MYQKYDIKEARERIYVTTDAKKGALKKLADADKYTTFVIPDNVGGRFSVLTPVGLLPIAVSGVNIDELMNGAIYAEEKYNDSLLQYNDCYQYAVLRNLYYDNGKNMEILATYEPRMHYFAEWWKQLFGESEGKENKGLFPVSVEFTTDLHSLGQYIQEGQRIMFETVLNFAKTETDITIRPDEDNLDNLNYLAGKKLSYVNQKAMEGTVTAHADGGVPNIIINIRELNAKNIGELIYFFEKACATSAKLLEVDPFNQPGVEKYKTNMFKLLKKPGYEDK
jgi:glucose-6-phosphate isomerase